MKLDFNIIAFLIIVSILISCNGSVNKNKQADTLQINSELKKISLPKNGFSNAFLDHSGNLWFASNGGGVFFYDGNRFINYTKKDGLNSMQVFSIIQDKRDVLWFGTQNGLTSFNGTKFDHVSLPFQDTSSVWLDKVYPIISPNAVHSLAIDQKDNIWIGTGGGGAYCYDGNYFKPFLFQIGQKQEDSLYHNWIPFIREDNEGNLWFASMTHGGVTQFNGEKFTQFLIEDGLSDNQVRTIYCDNSGKIWLGFNGNRNSGLTVYDGITFKSYSVEDGLCNQRIRTIFEDKYGRLWLGSQLGKLCLFDGENFSEFSYEGESFDGILFIIGDLKDNIWFGGSEGIWKFDGKKVYKMTSDN